MSDLSVRRAESDSDLARWASLHNAIVRDDPETLESVRHGLRIDPDGLRLLGLVDGEVVGYASAGRWYAAAPDAPALWMELGVLPGARRQGLGSVLLRLVGERARERERPEIVCAGSDDAADGLDFLRKRGFRIVDRFKMVALDLRTAPALARRELAEGLSIVSLAERPDLVEEVYAVAVEALPDIPDDEPVVAGDLEHWRRLNVDMPDVRHDAFLIALEDGEVVGFAALAISPADPKTAFHNMTAVARAHRGRGVARALKEAHVRWARRAGVERLLTGNNERNEPIRRLNRRLGYTSEPDRLLLRGPAP